jgi:hypothetical protein
MLKRWLLETFSDLQDDLAFTEVFLLRPRPAPELWPALAAAMPGIGSEVLASNTLRCRLPENATKKNALILLAPRSEEKRVGRVQGFAQATFEFNSIFFVCYEPYTQVSPHEWAPEVNAVSVALVSEMLCGLTYFEKGAAAVRPIFPCSASLRT